MEKIQPFNSELMENIVQMMVTMSSSMENQPEQKPFVAFLHAMSGYIRRILDATSNDGMQIAYNHVCLWPELFYAFDIQPLCPDVWSLIPAITDTNHNPDIIDAAENAGVFQELCSVDRAIMGKIFTGGIPKPAIQIIHTQPCDSTIMAYSMVDYLYGDVPCFVLDSPYWDTPECIDYYATQLKEMISFIKIHTGKKLDMDRLKEVIEESNNSIEYLIEWQELKKLTPCPVDGTFAAGMAFPGNLIGLGHPSITELFKVLYEHAKEFADKGEGPHPREDIRGVWFQFHPTWDMALQGWLQQEFGHVRVMDLFGYVTSVPIDTSSFDSMIRGLSERWHTSIPMGRQGRGPADIYINDLLYSSKEFKGDVVICTGHAGCRYMKGIQGLIRDACRDFGIPYFHIDVDSVDQRYISQESLRAQIADFISNVVIPAKG